MKLGPISEEEILQNKEDFLNILIPAVETRGMESATTVLNKLVHSDFFVAPASTKYHGAWKGGLCRHSLEVYYCLWDMIMMLGLQNDIDRVSVAIVALLHDFSKREFYEKDCRNKKVYSETGSKYDNLGKFDWVAEECYKIKDDDKRFIYGSHEETAEFMVRQMIPSLTYEESCAILHHMGGMDYSGGATITVSQVYNNYTLACLLHLADMMATYVIGV